MIPVKVNLAAATADPKTAFHSSEVCIAQVGDLWETELEAKPCNEVSRGETEELVGEFRCQDGHDRACSRLCVDEVRVTKRHLNRR
jgi:hypothetical protein